MNGKNPIDNKAKITINITMMIEDQYHMNKPQREDII